jgi:hypothetical protein
MKALPQIPIWMRSATTETMRSALWAPARKVSIAVAGEIVARKISITRVRLRSSTSRSSKSVRVRALNLERRLTASCFSAQSAVVATTMTTPASSHRSTGFPSHRYARKSLQVMSCGI